MPSTWESMRGENAIFQPACDIEEQDDHYRISMDVPGMKKDDIQIEVRDHQLMISGARHEEMRRDDQNLRMVERRFGRFQRAFTLPSGINPEQIEANYENGVLRLAVPKVEEARARQIRIGESKGLLGKLVGRREKEAPTETAHPATAQRKPA